MDEISPFIDLPLNLGSLVVEESIYATCVDIAGFEQIANTSKTLFSEPSMTKLSLAPSTFESRNSSSIKVPRNGIIKIELNCDNSKDGEEISLVMTKPSESCLCFSKKDDPKGIITDGALSIGDRIDKNSNICENIERSESWVSTIASFETVDDLVSLRETDESASIKHPKRAFSASLLEVSAETKTNIPSSFPPLWGLTSICGRRAEMEDSAVAVPQLLKIPPQMLSDNPLFSSIHKDLTAHVFGVYDGHGGCQVAKYCRERMHISLAEEIGAAIENLKVGNGEHNLKDNWVKIFHRCFHRLDNEVGGFVASDVDEPIAPESVGSTALVAIVCSTHIIVANCGDSRAVMNRGKVAMPLSIDHKPNREDECARIEAAGGKVINWDGYRVSGVLAVSRSIGDRYLSPYVVADPEIMFVPRTKEDECLILATDGLWDVMTNEEACDLARKRILLWHKKNGAGAATTTPTLTKGGGMAADPASQDAADYLSKLAFQRGSSDNISVIVADLKSQRKFKRKT